MQASRSSTGRRPVRLTCNSDLHLEEVAERVPVNGVGSDAVGLVVGLLGEPFGLVSVDDGLASPQVGFLRLDLLGLVNDLVAHDHDEVERDTLGKSLVESLSAESRVVTYKVASDEVLVLEAANEDVEVLGQRHEAAESQGAVATPQAEGRLVAHGLLVNALRAASLDEVDVCNQNGDPCEETKDGNEVDEVAEDNLCGAGNVHESEAAESSGEEERGDWHTALVRLGEELGSIALHGLTVESTAGNVEIGVRCGEDEDQNAGVEDARKVFDAGFIDSDNEGRSGGGALVSCGATLVCINEFWAVVWHAHSEQKHREDVEHNDTPEGQLDGTRNVAARVLGLSNGDTDKFGSEEGEDSRDHGGPNSKEATSRASGCVRLERARGFPVPKPNRSVPWNATGGDADHENEQSNDDDDLRRREVELKLAEELDTKVVDANDNDEEYGNPDTRVDSIGRKPILNDQSGCSQLVGRNNDVFEPVGVSSSETKGRVTETSGISGETTSRREPGCHFTETAHDNVYQETDHRVGDEDRRGAGLCECRTSSDNQTGALKMSV